MTEKEEKEIKYFEYVTVNGEVPERADTWKNKRLERIGYIIAVPVGIIIYFLIFH